MFRQPCPRTKTFQKNVGFKGYEIISLPGTPHYWPARGSQIVYLRLALCVAYTLLRLLSASEKRGEIFKSRPIYSTSSLHRHKEQHGIGVWPLLEPNFIAVSWLLLLLLLLLLCGVDKAPGDAARQASPWDRGAPKRTEYKNLFWILSDGI